MKENITIVISCAGKGTRLGAGTTKALIDVDGKSILQRQLEILKEYDDIRIVVGYQAEKVIELVDSIRPGTTFLYNNEYETTGTAASFSKGLQGAREYIVAFDGDLLVKPEDLIAFLDKEGECIGGCTPTTDNPVLMSIEDGKVCGFSREVGQLEWTGLAKVRADRLTPGTKHVYMMLEPLLPVDVIKISTREVDTPNDLKNAINWIKNCYND